jgi:hypothetical protein
MPVLTVAKCDDVVFAIAAFQFFWNEHCSTNQAPVLEIVICLLGSAEWIAIDEDFETSQSCHVDDFPQCNAAAVQTGYQLCAGWHFEEVEGDGAANFNYYLP